MTKIDIIDRETDLALLMFYFAGDVEGITRVQKLLFLLEEESELGEEYNSISFDFDSYKYGPFSEQVYDEVELLLNMNAIEAVESDKDFDWVREENDNEFAGKKFKLTEKGQKMCRELSEIAGKENSQDLEALMNEYNTLSLKELLGYVYEQYPEYTTESEIKAEILGKDA